MGKRLLFITQDIKLTRFVTSSNWFIMVNSILIFLIFQACVFNLEITIIDLHTETVTFGTLRKYG